MTKESLLGRIPNLPEIKIGTVAEDDQIIEGFQGQVHYKMTKETIPQAGVTIFSLSTSGPREERLAFIKEVAAEIGEPVDITEFSKLPGIHFAFWEAGSVEKKLRS